MLLRRRDKRHYQKYKEATRALVHARLAYFNLHYHAELRKVLY